MDESTHAKDGPEADTTDPDRMSDEELDAAEAYLDWRPLKDGWPMLQDFEECFRSGAEVRHEVLHWLYKGLSSWAMSGGKTDLPFLLGLNGAAKRAERASREYRDDRILWEMDVLVFMEATPEEAAWIVSDSMEEAKELTVDTILRKFKSKRERLRPEVLPAYLEACGGAALYLQSFTDTYMSEKLLSMKRQT